MEPPSLAPDRYRVLSGSALKVIAVVSMLVDHTAKRILAHYPWFVRPLYRFGQTDVSWYVLSESFGRIAFPIFCFLLVEGFVHTHDRRRYGINLLIFALVSEPIFDLCRMLTPFDPTYQNVFVTLFVSYLGLCALEGLRDRPALRAGAVVGLALVSMGSLCDYGPRGYAMVLMLYALRDQPVIKTALGCCITTSTWRAGLAFVPINLYNGQRGFIRGPVLKYAFYAFYPLHLFVLWQLRVRLGF
ncbi:MAG: hypothetical protein J6S63_10900 [Atopobiaceae bacterium]|nr:hypothetical protein [Atopobiaceae bacterium]